MTEDIICLPSILNIWDNITMHQGHLRSTWAIRFIAFPLMFNNFSQCAPAGLLLGWSSGSYSPQTETTVHLSRGRATEGEMDWYFIIPSGIFTAVLAVVVYLQRKPWWDPEVCSLRMQGKVAVVTGANTGWCHSSSIICSFFPMMI